MFSQKLNRPIDLLAVAIVVGGGAYGIVSATAGNGSGSAAASSSSSASSGQPVAGGGGSNARSGPAAGGSSGTVDSVSKSSFTLSTSAGQKVTVERGVLDEIPEGDKLEFGERHRRGESVLVLGTTNGTTITASAGHRATERQRRICNLLASRGGPLPAWCTVHVKAGRSDPGEPTARGRGRSPAERPRTERLKLRWPPTREASSTGS